MMLTSLLKKSRSVKGSPISKALTCMKIYLNKQKVTVLSRRPILQSGYRILLYERFIHLTRINLRPNVQVFSTCTQQRDYCISHFWLLPGLVPFASLRDAG